MPESRTTQCARAYDAGKATLDEVVASARRGAHDYAVAEEAVDKAWGTTGDEKLRNWHNDGAACFVKDGWDGVVSAYVADYLNDEQFATLYAAYMARVKKR